jgi:hypothetical protein
LCGLDHLSPATARDRGDTRPFLMSKNPVLVESGRRGAVKRWAQADPSTRTSVRLDELDSRQKRLILALVDAAKSAGS